MLSSVLKGKKKTLWHDRSSSLFFYFLSKCMFLFFQFPFSVFSCSMSGQSLRTEPSPEEDLGSIRSKSAPAPCWPDSFRAHKTNFYISFEIILCLFFYFSLIPLCKSMKTRLCSLYRQRFLTDTGSSDGPRCLSPALQERAQTMVQCVSVWEVFTFFIAFLLFYSLIN